MAIRARIMLFNSTARCLWKQFLFPSLTQKKKEDSSWKPRKQVLGVYLIGSTLSWPFVSEMGIEINRFQGEVDEELLCPICSSVLENPLQVKEIQSL